MQKTAKRFSVWSAWNHEGEEAWLNKMSEQGLHLKKAYLFWSTFTEEPAARYVYRLDYQFDVLTGEKFVEYINLYADAGWEYKCTFMGRWHYFRQPWKAGERQELYTDRGSLRDHYKRIRRILAAVLLMNLPVGLLNLQNVRNISMWDVGTPVEFSVMALLAVQAFMVLLVGYGFMKITRKVRDLS